MSQGDRVIRLAAKGDGITQSGAYIRGAAPGDVVQLDGTLRRGESFQEPACKHFNQCGGCQLQHCNDKSLAEFVRDRVVNAASGQGLETGEVLPTHLSPPGSRRRATLHALKRGKSVLLGYKQERSHKLVDLNECPVLTDSLADMVVPLRNLLRVIAGRAPIDIHLAEVDQGIALAFEGIEIDGLEATETVLDFARDHRLARLSLDQGFGDEPMWEPQPLTVTIGTTPIPYPSGAFLQATPDAEKTMLIFAQQWIPEDARMADLFSGLGTFSFALAGKAASVVAYEAARDAHLACRMAANRSGSLITCEHRDLFRNPLNAEELAQFDVVLLDPPRAGAKDQIAQIAQSLVDRVVYISCNPSSWARDGAQLQQAGFRLNSIKPIGQFRWSTHVELASVFTR